MTLANRLSLVARANINNRQYTNPEKELERVISDLEKALVQTKLAIRRAESIPTQKVKLNADILKLEQNLIILEKNIAEAKYRRDLLKSRAATAKANEQLHYTIGRLGTSSAMDSFERMEEKVLEMEPRSQISYELADNDLEQPFKQLEGGSDVDDELAAMKAQLTGGSVSQQALPTSEEKTCASTKSDVDAELEALRKQIENL